MSLRSDADAGGTGTSLYVHVPFCVVKCGYCDFNSYVVEDQSVHDRFLAALDAELGSAWREPSPVSVFVGGGTPSLLDPARLQRLFEVLSRHVDLTGCSEVTMEANPESLTAEKAALARAAGVSRLSLGVQSFHPHHLRRLDRAHSGERAEAAFLAARAAGFDNISLDLMFGLPGETAAEWEADLDRALALRPDHLSCYNLTFEPGTRMHRDLQRGLVAANEQEIDRDMFWATRGRLAAAGYEAYEISNFAGRGGKCRHNDHYWQQGDYVGVGPGASSHRRGVRWTNLKAVDAWADAALAGMPCAASAETLWPAQRAAEALWLGIRRATGIDLAQIAARLDWPVQARFASEIERHERSGWVRRRGARLELTEQGLVFADRIGGDYLGVGVAGTTGRVPARA
ncbi:MAG: radical SAM family heme chaperone HemW [Planctomycetes bacterium]|nr:radical SAM family heme chaperone HemW [Planctomycetota bacterium]